jgi:hypothetical protein
VAAAGVFGIVFDRRRRHHVIQLVLVEEIGEVDVVALGRTGTEPLRVADNHVVGIAVRVEFREGFGLEVRPRRRLHRDFHAGLRRVVVDKLLQVVGRIPFSPEDCQFFCLGPRMQNPRKRQCGSHEQRNKTAFSHASSPFI